MLKQENLLYIVMLCCCQTSERSKLNGLAIFIGFHLGVTLPDDDARTKVNLHDVT